jgi:hypothetical protein
MRSAQLVIAALIAFVIAGASLFIPGVLSRVLAIVRPQPPPRITSLTVTFCSHLLQVLR